MNASDVLNLRWRRNQLIGNALRNGLKVDHTEISFHFIEVVVYKLTANLS
jgi:hypothetical protein